MIWLGLTWKYAGDYNFTLQVFSVRRSALFVRFLIIVYVERAPSLEKEVHRGQGQKTEILKEKGGAHATLVVFRAAHCRVSHA